MSTTKLFFLAASITMHDEWLHRMTGKGDASQRDAKAVCVDGDTFGSHLKLLSIRQRSSWPFPSLAS